MEYFLARVHDSSWTVARAEEGDADEGDDIIKRLVDSGASPDDLARFARLMQRQYLSNLGCILDGSGIYGTPDLPCEEFRIFSVNESGKPQAGITALHELVEFSDWETEIKLSREAAEAFDRNMDQDGYGEDDGDDDE